MRYEDIRHSPERDQNDCTVVAASIVGNMNYGVARKLMHRFGRRTGCGMSVMDMLYALHRAGLKLEPAGSWFPMHKFNNFWLLGLNTAGMAPQIRKPRNRFGDPVTEFRSAYLFKSTDSWSRYSAKTIGRLYPKGKYIVFFSGHVAAMVDGKIEDYTEDRKYIVRSIYKVTGEVSPERIKEMKL